MNARHDPVVADTNRHYDEIDQTWKRDQFIATRSKGIAADTIEGPTKRFDYMLGDAVFDHPHCERYARFQQQIAQCVHTNDDVSLLRVAKACGAFMIERLTADAVGKATCEADSPEEYEGDEL